MPNWYMIEGTWRQWKSQGLQWWSRLTEAEWDEMDGNRESLLSALELKYGWTRAEAKKEVDTRFGEFGTEAEQEAG